jgi:hypothetical protein
MIEQAGIAPQGSHADGYFKRVPDSNSLEPKGGDK